MKTTTSASSSEQPTIKKVLQDAITKQKEKLLEDLMEKAQLDEKKDQKWVVYFKHLAELQQKEACRAAMPWLEKPYNPPLWDLKPEEKAGEWFSNTLISVLEKDPERYNTSAIQEAIAKNKTVAQNAAKKTWVLDNKRHLSLPLPLAALCPTMDKVLGKWQYKWRYLDRETGTFLKDAVTLKTCCYLENTELDEQDEQTRWVELMGLFFGSSPKLSSYLETMADWRTVAEFLDGCYPKQSEPETKAIAYAKVSRLRTWLNRLNTINILMEAEKRSDCLYLLEEKGRQEKNRERRLANTEKDTKKLEEILTKSVYPSVLFKKLGVSNGSEENPIVYPLWDFSLFPPLVPELCRPFRFALNYAMDNRETLVKAYLEQCSATQLQSLIRNIISPEDPILVPVLGCLLERHDRSNPDLQKDPSYTESSRGTNSGYHSEYHGRPWDKFLDTLFAKITGEKKRSSDYKKKREAFFGDLLRLADEGVKEESQQRQLQTKTPLLAVSEASKKGKSNRKSSALQAELKNRLQVLICGIIPVYLSYLTACKMPPDYRVNDTHESKFKQDLNKFREGSLKLKDALPQNPAELQELRKRLSTILPEHIQQDFSDDLIGDITTVAIGFKAATTEMHEGYRLGAVKRLNKKYGMELTPDILEKCVASVNEWSQCLGSAPLTAQLGFTTDENEVQ